MIRQSSTRAFWLAIPGASRQRFTSCGDGFQQRRGNQGHTNSSLDGAYHPCSWQLHGRRVLPNIEVRLDHTAMPIANSEFLAAQLPCRRRDNQWPRISRVIYSDHIQDRFRMLLIMQSIPTPQSDLALLTSDLALFVRRQFWRIASWMQDRSMRKRTAFLAGARWRRRTQFAVDSQSPHQRILIRSHSESLFGGNPGIDDNQPFPIAFRQICKRLLDGLLTIYCESGATHQAATYALDHHNAGQGRHNVGAHGTTGTVVVSFANQSQTLVGSPSGNHRSVKREDFALLGTQADGLSLKVGQAPVVGGFKQQIQRELAALHSAFDTMPSPTQMHDKWQSRARQTPFSMNQATGHHGDQDNANKISRAQRQKLNETTHRRRSQINWSRARILGYWFWFHTSSIPNPTAPTQS